MGKDFFLTEHSSRIFWNVAHLLQRHWNVKCIEISPAVAMNKGDQMLHTPTEIKLILLLLCKTDK